MRAKTTELELALAESRQTCEQLIEQHGVELAQSQAATNELVSFMCDSDDHYVFPDCEKRGADTKACRVGELTGDGRGESGDVEGRD